MTNVIVGAIVVLIGLVIGYTIAMESRGGKKR